MNFSVFIRSQEDEVWDKNMLHGIEQNAGRRRRWVCVCVMVETPERDLILYFKGEMIDNGLVTNWTVEVYRFAEVKYII